MKVAPTGTAASNIEGQTLHTAFSFSFDGKTYSLSDKARDLRRKILCNLKMIIIQGVPKKMSFLRKTAITIFKLIQNAKLGGVLENSGYLLPDGH